MALIFQIIAAVILVLLINAFGKASRGFGYVNVADILGEGNLGFNLIFRILSPAIFISFLSIILYKLGFNDLIHDIWLIVLWYIVINFILLLLLNRWPFVNKPLYLSIQISALGIAYWFYTVALSRGLEFILPEGANFRTEIWLIIIIYFYNLLSNYFPNYSKFYQSRSHFLKKRFEYFKQKYSHLLFDEFLKNELLNKLFYSIMIFEDINRPRAIRILERMLFPLGLVKSTGIMQIKNKGILTDEESIKLAQKKILKSYEKNKDKIREEYELIRVMCLDYNGGEYFYNIDSIYHEIKY